MSQAEDLLNSLEEPEVAAYSADPVTEPHIVINRDKTVTIPEQLKRILVQYEHNIETVTFDCPRHWDGHDLSEMGMKVVFQRSDGHKESHPVENLRVDNSDDSMIHFDWTISRNTTLVGGEVSITVCAKIADAEGIVDREWHTIPNQDLYVNEGMDCTDDEIVEQNPDIIESILVRLDLAEQGGASDEQIAAAVEAYMTEHPVEVPDSGQNINPVAKTEDMTQPVGVDAEGKLYTAPGEGGGAKDYTTLSNKPSINGVTLDGNKTAEDLGIGQPTGEQISEAVSGWLDEHPEATSTVGVRSVGEEKIKYGAVHGMLLDKDLQANMSNYDRMKLHTETAYGAYIQGQIAADGTVDTTKTGKVSEAFRCYPREVLRLSNQLTTKIAYYTESMEFISTATTTAGVFEYKTPDNAHWYRLQNQYSYGDIPLITVRDKELKNRTFRDLILSPIKCRPTVCFTGDSNTYGYGLSSVDKSWANLFISQLSTIGELTYDPFSKWVRNCGAIKYGSATNFKPGAYMEFVTDTETVALKIGANYSAAWSWYVDGVTDSANDNAESIALDGNEHTVRVMFTGGQAVSPKFAITKSVTCINKAVSGVSAQNMLVESGCDWLIVMIGTNHRTENNTDPSMSLVEYSGKGSYILPVPTHKVDDSYTRSLFQTIPPLTELFEAYGFEVVNCVPELSPVFSDAKYLQADKSHFSEEGHVIICNTVSAKMGLPTYLSISE